MGLFINFDRDSWNDMWHEEIPKETTCSLCNKKISDRQKWKFTLNPEDMSIDKVYHLKCFKELLNNA